MIYPSKRAIQIRHTTLISIHAIPNQQVKEYSFHFFDEDHKRLQDFVITVSNSKEAEMLFLVNTTIPLPYDVIHEAIKIVRENERAARRIQFQAEYESNERKR